VKYGYAARSPTPATTGEFDWHSSLADLTLGLKRICIRDVGVQMMSLHGRWPCRPSLQETR